MKLFSLTGTPATISLRQSLGFATSTTPIFRGNQGDTDLSRSICVSSSPGRVLRVFFTRFTGPYLLGSWGTTITTTFDVVALVPHRSIEPETRNLVRILPIGLGWATVSVDAAVGPSMVLNATQPPDNFSTPFHPPLPLSSHYLCKPHLYYP